MVCGLSALCATDISSGVRATMEPNAPIKRPHRRAVLIHAALLLSQFTQSAVHEQIQVSRALLDHQAMEATQTLTPLRSAATRG